MQKGLFQELGDTSWIEQIRGSWPWLADVTAARQAVESYPSITFRCSNDEMVAARGRINELLPSTDPLLMLTQWAVQTAAQVKTEPSKSLSFAPNVEQMKEQLPNESIQRFELIANGNRDGSVGENGSLMLDYVEHVALRSVRPIRRYDAGALYLLARAMTDRHWLCQPPNQGTASGISRLQTFMSKADYYWAISKDGHLGRPPLWPPIPRTTIT